MGFPVMDFFMEFLGRQKENVTEVEEPPLEPSSEPNVWLDASDPTYISKTGSDVNTWTSRDAGALVFTANTTGIAHDISATLGDGTTQYTLSNQTTAVKYLTANWSYSSTNIIVYTVFRINAAQMTSNNRRVIALGTDGTDDTNNAGSFFIGKVTGNSTNIGARRAGVNLVFSGAGDTNYIVTAVYNTRRQLYNGLTLVTDAAHSGALSIAQLRICNGLAGTLGTGGQWTGRLGEIMIFTAEHDTETREHNINYLATKWGVAV